MPTALRPAAGVAAPWAEDPGAVAAALGVDTDIGLPSPEAARRLAGSGPNELDEEPARSPLVAFAAQLTNTMTVVLSGAAVITALIGETTDAVVIAMIVVLDAVVGFVQEHRAERAMAALRRLTADEAVVRRDGRPTTVPVARVVPGDVVMLTAGDVVPADCRLVESAGLRVNEAALTGESEPAVKVVHPIADAPVPADRRNMAHRGTAVTYGRGAGVVVATGMDTELGRIAALLRSHSSDSTPLQRRLARLGRGLAMGAALVSAAVFGAGVAAGEAVDEMFLTAVSVAVAAIPEGLPAVVTVALALGARRMAERNAIVRTLPAVETLGSITVICTDKTGTLTQNRMLVEKVWTAAGGEREVTGDGYAPFGEVSGGEADADLVRLARAAAACNDAVLHAPTAAGGEWTITGDPTEGALAAFAAKAGADRPPARLAEVAFDAVRRRMTTAHADDDGGVWVASKGALEALTPNLDRVADEAVAVAARWAAGGHRVLALADRRLRRLPDAPDDLERDLRLAGLVAIADPPRVTAAASIAACHDAGITPVVITGDDPRTAAAIATRLGVLEHGGRVVTGAELDGWDDARLATDVRDIAVYARTTPEQKLRIVDAWKTAGAVVAMTGDGVNDAPALRRADIGVAMGITGTDVSKEAADIVLADDDFATIVHAVGEGRRIYDNVRRFVRYLLSTNTGEIWLMLAAPLLGMPIPLVPVQLLWVNLVTDGLPAVALGMEPQERDVMHRPPRAPDESVFARGLWQHALWVGILMGGVGLAVQAGARAAGWEWRTMVFTAIAFLSLGHALAIRSEVESLRSLGVRSNPWLRGAIVSTVAMQLAIIYVPALHSVFRTRSLGAVELVVTLAASTVVFVAVEAHKAVTVRRRP